MANTLATILDDAGNRALVKEYLEKQFLARRDYDTALVNAKSAMRQTLPSGEGQYVEWTRKGRFRLPEKVDLTNETADPASGALMAVEKVKYPIEFIHEYIPVGTIASMTSWIDLKNWAKDDLPTALTRRMHRLAQNAFAVGRYRPGKYDAAGAESVAFDTTVEATSISMYGLTFTFASAPKYYANSRPTFNALQASDRAQMDDFKRIRTKLRLAGAIDFGGKLMAYISESMQQDLMDDCEYFEAAIRSFVAGTKSLVNGHIADYAGFHWVIDDEAYTEDWNTEETRATEGAIHSAFICGKDAWGYIGLGKDSRFKPRFKVQDITKTGGEHTIGYTVPFQVGVVNPDWCAVYKAPVSEFTPNNS